MHAFHFLAIMKTLLVISVLLALTAQSCSQVSRPECREQQETCECERNAKRCEFRLVIEELQTFASYVVQDDELLTRGIAGSTYYMSPDGLRPSIPPGPGRNNCTFMEPVTFGSSFTNQSCSIPMLVDGTSYRSFIAVNGRIPGPTLIMDEGTLVKIRVVNHLTSEGVTIHWHGMHQRKTPWMDGVGFISQPPIGPGANFDYIFNATPAGTHWYHSHVGAQRTDGLFGALVVREKTVSFENVVIPQILIPNPGSNTPAPSYTTIQDIPSQHTLTLLDWQREASLDLFVRINSALGFYSDSKPVDTVPTDRNINQLYPRTLSTDNVEVGPVPYWSGLINGRGVYDIDNASTFFNLSVFHVRDSTVGYRFRVAGAQSLYAYSLSIDGHQLRVIASDGHFIEPVLVDFLIVHSGERYDFIPERADTQDTTRRYWIRAETLEVRDQMVHTVFDPRTEHSARAVLTYGEAMQQDTNWTNRYEDISDSPRSSSCTADTPCQVLNCPFESYPSSAFRDCVSLTSLRALPMTREQDPPLFGDAEEVFLNFGFEGSSDTSAINGRNFKLPATPYQTYCGQYERDQNVTDGTVNTCRDCVEGDNPDCRCTNVISIVRDDNFFGKEPLRTVMMVFSAVNSIRNSTRFSFSHPVHLHGHSFYVLHIGYGEYTDGRLDTVSDDVVCDSEFCMNPSWNNGQIPEAIGQADNNGRINSALIRKDTVILPAGGYVVVAFRADNPGYWFLHCHIEVHQLEGMGVLIQEYPYRQHTAPLEGINRHGNFLQDLGSYEEQTKRCGAVIMRASVVFVTLIVFVLAFAF